MVGELGCASGVAKPGGHRGDLCGRILLPMQIPALRSSCAYTFCDGEPQLLLNELLGGGRCVGASVKLCVFDAFPFDAHRRYYAKGAGVLCG